MLNMIKLDWLGMKIYHKRFIVIPCAIFIYGFFYAPVVIPFLAFLMLSFSVNPFAVEEKGKLDNLYLTLPVTRKMIVNARYGLSLIMQFIGLASGIIVTVLYSKLLYGKTTFGITHSFDADFKTMFLITCGSFLLYTVMNLSSFPLLFKIGYAKGRGLGFYLPAIGFTIAVTAVYFLWYYNAVFKEFLLSSIDWAFENTIPTAALMLACAVLILMLSYKISTSVYAKREF